MSARGRPSTLMTVREVTTPEGVPLPFEVASGGDRAAAFLLDSLLQFVVVSLALWLASFASEGEEEGWTLALLLVMSFFLRNFYFAWFELRWQGATPGKRVTRTRVMDADGGPLRADAVLVRNLMRELEIWLPLSVLLAPAYIWPDAPGWARLVSGLWALVFAFLPLFNRHRMRVGDLVAGTIVVRAPRAVLLADLGGKEVKRAAATYRFTDRQLDVYGIYELQVLEDLLRLRPALRNDQALRAVCGRIRRKIGWADGEVQTERFLREFYAALRARLEQKMLLGKRKADKHSRDE